MKNAWRREGDSGSLYMNHLQRGSCRSASPQYSIQTQKHTTTDKIYITMKCMLTILRFKSIIENCDSELVQSVDWINPLNTICVCSLYGVTHRSVKTYGCILTLTSHCQNEERQTRRKEYSACEASENPAYMKPDP